MTTETQISPEVHARAKRAVTVEFKDGKLSYLVYGVVRVASLDEAIGMLCERRKEPREPQLMPPPVDVAEMNRQAALRELESRIVEPFPWQV